MTTARRSVFMTGIVLLSALAGGIAFSTSVMALESSSAAPYPHSPGVTTDSFPVSIVAQRNDAITQNGMKTMTIDFGTDTGFDGSVQNVSSDSVSVSVIGENNQRTVSSAKVSTKQGRIKITFPQPVSVQAGDRIVADVGNVTTPSSEGDYGVAVSASTPSGTTDGPVSDDYRVAGADLTFPNQSASQFSANQSVTISGVVPNAGYIGVFETTQNGSRGQLVGNTQPIVANYGTRNYTVNLNGNVNQSQQLVAVAYYETSGESASQRLNASFDPDEDHVVMNNGAPANATGFVKTIDADGRVTAGNEYDQGARLFFSQGQAETGYRVQKLKNGNPDQTVDQFETGANGTATLNTSGYTKGQYVITRIDDGSVVGLDNDSTTSPQDDSFFVTSQTFSQTTTANTNASGDGTTAAGTGGSGGNANGSAGGNSGASGNGSGGTNSSGSGGSGSGAFGPGFGPVVAIVALLGAALLAVRRAR